MRYDFKNIFLAAAMLLSGCSGVDSIGNLPEETIISLDGITNYSLFKAEGGTKTFTLQVNCDWTIAVNGMSWASLTPTVGGAYRTVTLTLSVSPNTTKSAREGSFILMTTDGSASRTFVVAQEGPVPEPDTHEVGYVFFEDDFSWVTEGWDDSYLSYGWPTVISGSLSNEIPCRSGTLSSGFKAKGYTTDGNDVYGRYEGFLKLGSHTSSASLSTPAMSGVDASRAASMELSFDVAVYCSAAGVFDKNKSLKVSIDGDGYVVDCGSNGATVSADKKSVVIPIQTSSLYKFTWIRKHVILGGITSTTKIRFGEYNSAIGARFMLDNIKTIKVEENALPGADSTNKTEATDYSFEAVSSDNLSGLACTVPMVLRSNKAWSVKSDASWFKVGQITAGNESGCVTMNEDGSGAEVNACAINFANSYFIASANTDSSPREARLTFTVDGEAVKTISFVQNAATDAEGVIAKWTFTGLYCTSFNGLEPVPSSAGYRNAAAWIGDSHSVPSDVLPGSFLSASVASENAAFSAAATNRSCNMLRIKGLSKDDHFLFTVPLVNVLAGSVINFRNLYLAVTNYSASPRDWAVEYSFDSQKWIEAKKVKMTTGHYSLGGENSESLDCDIPVEDAIKEGTLYLRIRVTSNSTGSGTFFDGSSDIAYIYVDPSISWSTPESQTATYTAEKDYVIFNVTKP